MAATSNPSSSSRMSASPKSAKKNIKDSEPVKAEESIVTGSEPSTDTKPTTSTVPLAPPPKPPAVSDAPDYFSQTHSSAFSHEPNPFEDSFANPSVDTPGRTILPPVANITSPAPLLPGLTPGWEAGSLRTGPLSPAMLPGPTQTDYFQYRGGFPTPNESSLRTGLTPGGGGSMFPAPSPNTQAMFMASSGVATPSTADFQQTSLRAAAQANQGKLPPTSAPTSQPDAVSMAMKFPPPQGQRGAADQFANHDVSTAANDLLSFSATARNGGQSFAVPNPPAQMNNAAHMPVQPVEQPNGRRSSRAAMRPDSGSADHGDHSESNHSEEARVNTRTRGKKATTNGKQTAGTKRKADDTNKGGNRKKMNNGTPSLDGMDDDSEEDTSPKPEDGKKMTDEEKRRNFLERNRVAALKCRQRKKQWLANLQQKVEMYSAENDTLTATVTQLREEIVNLKTVLLAHKDCPISVQQGIAGGAMNSFLGTVEPSHNPYGLTQMPNGVPMGMMQPGPQMQNR